MSSAEIDESERLAACPLCVRTVKKDTQDEAEELVESHNDQRHDGNDVAKVLGPYKEDLNEFMDHVRKQYGTDTFERFARHIIKKDPWGVLDRSKLHDYVNKPWRR